MKQGFSLYGKDGILAIGKGMQKINFTTKIRTATNGELFGLQIYGRIRSMFLECKFKESTKYQLIGEASRTVTMLNNIMTLQVNQKSPHAKLFGSKPKYAKALRRIGELGVVWSGKGIKGKMSDRGTTHLFVGYCDNHAENIYRMLNPKTKKISITRNIKWLNRMYNVKRGIETSEKTDTELELEIPGGIKDELADSEPEEEDDKPGPYPRVLRTLKRLLTSYNPTLKDMVDIALVGGTKYGHENPVTFQEAWYHEDKHEIEKWCLAIRKELESMIEKKV